MCLAVPGKILDITGDTPLARRARVSFGGVVKDISLAYVPEAEVGQYVIVHVGLALSVVDEVEAERTLKEFEKAGFGDFTVPETAGAQAPSSGSGAQAPGLKFGAQAPGLKSGAQAPGI